MSSCEVTLHSENESASLSLTNQAGVSLFGARSVGEFISRTLGCQALSCVHRKKISVDAASLALIARHFMIASERSRSVG
jgi:hypothetical protein